MRDYFHFLTIDAKVAATTAVGTTSVGVASFLDYIPDGIGKLASVFGIILTVVLIITHLWNGHLQRKKLYLEIKQMERGKETPPED